MNLKGISIIVGAAAVILLVVLLPIKPGDVPPAIRDTPELGEDTTLGIGEEDRPELGGDTTLGLDVGDTPTITESVTVTNETTDFYFDENGTKHFVLDAIDVINPPE